MSEQFYYIIFGFGRRFDNGRFDYIIAKNKLDEFGLYDHKAADNRRQGKR